MPLSNVWELTFTQAWGAGGERMLNNFFYTSVDPTANAQDLAEAFANPGQLLEAINGIQGSWVKNIGVRVINLGSLTDFFEGVIPGTGAAEADLLLPPHSAVNFSLKVNTRAVKPGSKRFSGIGEVFQDHGVINSAPYIASLDLLAIELADSMVGTDASYEPIVVKRIGLPTPGTPPYTSYRLPETDGELVFGNVTVALANLRVSHQVSRGNGR